MYDVVEQDRSRPRRAPALDHAATCASPRHSRSMSPRWNRRVHGSVGSSHHERNPANSERPSTPSGSTARSSSADARPTSVAGRAEHALELRDRARAPRGEDRRRVGERPAERHAGRDDLGLEHAERGRDHARAHLAEQRAAAREVGGAVGQRDEAGAPGARREAELRVRGVTLRREEHLADHRLERGSQRAALAKLDLVHGRSLSGAARTAAPHRRRGPGCDRRTSDERDDIPGSTPPPRPSSSRAVTRHRPSSSTRRSRASKRSNPRSTR